MKSSTLDQLVDNAQVIICSPLLALIFVFIWSQNLNGLSSSSNPIESYCPYFDNYMIFLFHQVFYHQIQCILILWLPRHTLLPNILYTVSSAWSFPYALKIIKTHHPQQDFSKNVSLCITPVYGLTSWYTLVTINQLTCVPDCKLAWNKMGWICIQLMIIPYRFIRAWLEGLTNSCLAHKTYYIRLMQHIVTSYMPLNHHKTFLS